MAVAECYFLDVGQGTSNVILLGQGRAIVIDCGRSAWTALRLLQRYVSRIVALIVSHNDVDHHGGAEAILAAYPKAIDRLYFLQDRPVEQLSLYALAMREHAAGNLVALPIRLEREDQKRVIYSDAAADLSLELLFPTFLDNLTAQSAASPNATSALLVLFCGSRRIVFPGDATVDEWRRVRTLLGGAIPCDIVAVPHHGGNISLRRAKGETPAAYSSRVLTDMRWVYSQAVQPSHAVISVGSSNDYRHPRSETLAALNGVNAVVLCTQITPRCHDDLEPLRPGVIIPAFPSRSTPARDLTQSGRSRNVGCAGTVVAEISPTQVAIQRLNAHQVAVDNLCGTPAGHPLCRPGKGTAAAGS
jgi:beta-lactamase superfamily II metal-dependent hydrolase